MRGMSTRPRGAIVSFRGFCRVYKKKQVAAKTSSPCLLPRLPQFIATHADGYGYSRFCELYQRWNRNRDVVLLPFAHRLVAIKTAKLVSRNAAEDGLGTTPLTEWSGPGWQWRRPGGEGLARCP